MLTAIGTHALSSVGEFFLFLFFFNLAIYTNFAKLNTLPLYGTCISETYRDTSDLYPYHTPMIINIVFQ